jgi:hypothetical protein
MDKYPPWLEKQEAAGSNSSLSAADLERYKQQYAAICALCQAYETDPGNTGKIMDLLQQVRRQTSVYQTSDWQFQQKLMIFIGSAHCNLECTSRMSVIVIYCFMAAR